MKYFAEVGERRFECSIEGEGDQAVVVVDGKRFRVDLEHIAGADSWTLLLDGRSYEFALHDTGEEIELSGAAGLFQIRVEDERTRAARSKTAKSAAAAGPRTVRSVMPGIVREVLVAVGQKVEKGQALLILEAMKMQNEVRADHAGTVQKLLVAAGATVEKGAPLLDVL